jgi:hypothetical protein
LAALREIRKVLQRPGEPRRRWFNCVDADLFVWTDRRGVCGFEFCYDKGRDEHALLWRAGTGFSHTGIDAGEDKPTRKRSPVAVAGERFDLADIARRFELLARAIDRGIYRFVLDTLRGNSGRSQ